MPGVDMAVVEHGILGIAGDEQHLQAGPQRARGIGDLAAVQPAGQADVGDQQVDRGVALQQLQPAGPSPASRQA